MRRSSTHYDLLDALAGEGCAVCSLTLKAVDRYIDSIGYEFVNDREFRANLESAWGFCTIHANQWLTQTQHLGTALIYEAVIRTLDTALAEATFTKRGGRRVGHDVLKPVAPCLICIARAEQERQLVTVLVESLTEDEMRGAYLQGPGLCVPHLRRALATTRVEAVFGLLKDHARAQLEIVRLQLKEFARKQDHQYRHEALGDERGSTERAVRAVTGLPGIDDGRR